MSMGEYSPNTVFRAAVKNTQDIYPGYLENILKARNIGGEGSRWARPTDLETLLAQEWTLYDEPASLLIESPSFGLKCNLPGFVGVEPLERLHPTTILTLSHGGDIKGQVTQTLSPVFYGRDAMVVSNTTIAIIWPDAKNNDLPFLATIIIGPPIKADSCAIKAGSYQNGDRITAGEAMKLGLKYYKVGMRSTEKTDPRAVVGDIKTPNLQEFDVTIGAAALVESTPFRVRASSYDEAKNIAIEIAKKRAISWVFSRMNGVCPVLVNSQPIVTLDCRDVAETALAIPREGTDDINKLLMPTLGAVGIGSPEHEKISEVS